MASEKRPREQSEITQPLLLFHDHYPGLSGWEAPTWHPTRSESGGGHAKKQEFNGHLGTRTGVLKCFLNPLQKYIYYSLKNLSKVLQSQ